MRVAAQQESNGEVLLEVPGNTYYTVMFLPKDGASAFGREREFEETIMVEVLIEEMFGSD